MTSYVQLVGFTVLGCKAKVYLEGLGFRVVTSLIMGIIRVPLGNMVHFRGLHDSPSGRFKAKVYKVKRLRALKIKMDVKQYGGVGRGSQHEGVPLRTTGVYRENK